MYYLFQYTDIHEIGLARFDSTCKIGQPRDLRIVPGFRSGSNYAP